MSARFHPAARAELQEAWKWYNHRSPLSATAFSQEIAAAISRIAEAPTRYPSAEHGTRRFALQRFPFHIFYRVGGVDIVVVAIAHQKRRPAYWRPR